MNGVGYVRLRETEGAGAEEVRVGMPRRQFCELCTIGRTFIHAQLQTYAKLSINLLEVLLLFGAGVEVPFPDSPLALVAFAGVLLP